MYNPDQIEQRKGRAWSAGSLRCIRLTRKYQLLKMQLPKYYSTKEVEFSASVTEYRREVLQHSAGKLQAASRTTEAPWGKAAKGANTTVVMHPGLGTEC